MTTAGSWTGRGSTMPTRLLLLRHGQSPLSVERRYSGRGNPELTHDGLEQAAAAATALAARHVGSNGNIRAVISSPLMRARQTAEPVAGVPRCPPACCCCATGRARCRWRSATPGAAIPS